MIVSFVYPSSHHRTGGVTVLYEMANGLARRGHEVHFVHGPLTEHRIDTVDAIPFRFEPRVVHHIVDSLDDPAAPESEICMFAEGPARLGVPVAIVQGYKMFTLEMERRVFRVAAPKVCVASWLCDVAAQFGSHPEQHWYVPLGMDHETFALRTPLDARSIDVAMLYHPHREKGFEVGLEALAAIRRRRPDARLLIFGMLDPPEIPEGIEYRQAPNHRTLADEIYNTTRVFVQSSFHEGFGYTPVEAMACGAALVTTDNGGSRDYGIHMETAWVVPPGDATGLADGIDALLRDDGLRIHLATAGERHVQKFDWDHTAELLEMHLTEYRADPARFQRPPADDAYMDQEIA